MRQDYTIKTIRIAMNNEIIVVEIEKMLKQEEMASPGAI